MSSSKMPPEFAARLAVLELSPELLERLWNAWRVLSSRGTRSVYEVVGAGTAHLLAGRTNVALYVARLERRLSLQPRRVVGVSVDGRGWPVFRVSVLEDSSPDGPEVQLLAETFQKALDDLDRPGAIS